MSSLHPDLDALLDGRLSTEQRLGAEEHLSGCERCRTEWERLQFTRGLLRAAAESQEMPESVTAHVMAGLDREKGPRRGTRWIAAATALGATAAILVAVVLLRKPDRDFPDAAVRDLGAVTAARVSLELRTGDTAELERWFDARLAFRTRVFDFAMMRYHLIGGRIDSMDGRESALFVYRHDDGALVVCQMFRGTTAELPRGAEQRVNDGIEFFVYERNGATVVFWQEGEVVCVLASTIPREEVLSLAFAKAMRVPAA